MIGRQIPLMTSQVIHICRNDYSDVETMIGIHLNPIHFSWPSIFFMAAATSLLFYRLWPCLTSLWRHRSIKYGQGVALDNIMWCLLALDRCLNFHNPTAGLWGSTSCPLIGQYWPLLWRHRSLKYAQLATPRSLLWYLCFLNSILLGRCVLCDKQLATVNQYSLTLFDLPVTSHVKK